jgi:hypothetical protein
LRDPVNERIVLVFAPEARGLTGKIGGFDYGFQD